MINTGRVVEDKHSTTEPEYWEYISLTALTDVEYKSAQEKNYNRRDGKKRNNYHRKEDNSREIY